MSSIAYTADENMLEYHRLCGHRDVIFWRLSAQKGFRNFRKGDLLFFFAKPKTGKKKGFVGYAHYDSTKRLSLNQMWERYGETNGYHSKEQLAEAIRKVSRTGEIPARMNCLYLTNIVFFLSPVYPEDAGIQVSQQLESFMYLDREDPAVTVRILRKAEENGIDLWSSAQSEETEALFRRDEIMHGMAEIVPLIASSRSEREEAAAVRLMKEKVQDAEPVRGSRTDYIRFNGTDVTVLLPFVSGVKDRKRLLTELAGKISLYRYYIRALNVPVSSVSFEVLTEETDPETEGLLRDIAHGEL
ncbi:MAG: hypothetical protein IJJ24_06210 [Solobacterium sp.]|nr:hypothetical protein [Solobacterium sp.]MBQ6592454.1 hypothetical protein [Solobacterium sp.]MBR0478672.1 hypothetical protein [Solobacterium sp.]